MIRYIRFYKEYMIISAYVGLYRPSTWASHCTEGTLEDPVAYAILKYQAGVGTRGMSFGCSLP